MGPIERGILAIVMVLLLLSMGVDVAFAFFGVGFSGLSFLSSVQAAFPVPSKDALSGILRVPIHGHPFVRPNGRTCIPGRYGRQAL